MSAKISSTRLTGSRKFVDAELSRHRIITGRCKKTGVYPAMSRLKRALTGLGGPNPTYVAKHIEGIQKIS